MSESEAARIRRNLKHPMVDADGHWLELMPVTGRIDQAPVVRTDGDIEQQGVDAGETRGEPAVERAAAGIEDDVRRAPGVAARPRD